MISGVEGFVALAKGLIALRTIVTSDLLVDDLEAVAELVSSRDTVAGLVSRTSLNRLSKKIADAAKASEPPTRGRTDGLSDERRLFEQAVPYALRAPGLVATALVDPDQVVKDMLQEVGNSPLRRDWTPAATSYFKRVVGAAVCALMADEATVKHALPEIFRALLTSQARMEERLREMDRKADEHADASRALQKEILKKLDELPSKMSPQFIAAAAEVATERAPRNTDLAMNYARGLIRVFETQRVEQFMDARPRQLTSHGDLRQALADAKDLLKHAVTKEEQTEALNQIALQHLLLLDMEAASGAIAQRAILNRGGRSEAEALLDEFVTWYERGIVSDSALHLEVAVLLAWKGVHYSSKDNLWRYMLNIGVSYFALAQSWGPVNLLRAKSAFYGAYDLVPEDSRDRSLIKANIGAIHQSIAREMGCPAALDLSYAWYIDAMKELEAIGDPTSINIQKAAFQVLEVIRSREKR